MACMLCILPMVASTVLILFFLSNQVFSESRNLFYFFIKSSYFRSAPSLSIFRINLCLSFVIFVTNDSLYLIGFGVGKLKPRRRNSLLLHNKKVHAQKETLVYRKFLEAEKLFSLGSSSFTRTKVSKRKLFDKNRTSRVVSSNFQLAFIWIWIIAHSIC